VNRITGNKVVNHMAATILEFSRVDLVQGVFLTCFGGPNIAIHSSYAGVCRNIVEPDPGRFDPGDGVAKIDEGPG